MGWASRLDAFSGYPVPNIATERCGWRHNSYTSGSSIPVPLVLGTAPLKSPAPTTDRDRTVSRRSKPSSRSAFNWRTDKPLGTCFSPQDAESRHRGAKPPRRCELLGEISLLSPAYLLSVERRPFHTAPPDHLSPGFPPARLVGLAVKPSYAFTLDGWFPFSLRGTLRAPPLHFRRRPPQSNCPPDNVARPG